jgi:hypothetical protein
MTRKHSPPTLHQSNPCLPPLLHADANLSSSSLHLSRGVPPVLKHPFLSLPGESALQALEKKSSPSQGSGSGQATMHTHHGQLTSCFSSGSPSRLVVVLSVPLGSCSSGSLKQAIPPGTRLLVWPSKLRTRGLELVSVRTPSPLA